MSKITLAPSEQALLVFALSRLLGVALLQDCVQVYCSPELTLTFDPKQIRALIEKVQE